jgi:hypothetical protein
LIELKYSREKISLLRADSVRLSNLNANLIVTLKQSRESTAYYKTRWQTVEKLFIVKNRKNKLKIIPRGRLQSIMIDVGKVALGFFIGKI